jgi:hypothetical protein
MSSGTLLLPPFRKTPRRHNRVSFFKYLTAPTARIVLATRKLRWSSPQIFLDPFDVPINLELPFKTTDLQFAIAQKIADMIESDTPFRQSQLANLAERIRALGREDTRRAVVEDLRAWPADGIDVPTISEIQQFWEKLRPDMRILCLCESNSVTPMWATYANGHTGVVVEFIDHDHVDSALAIARPVTYRHAPPRLATQEQWIDSILDERPFDLKEFFTDYQYVKHTHWGHEFEWRIISYKRHGESGLYSDWGFDPRELAAIYFGSRISDDDARDLTCLLTHGLEHVRIFRAVENQQELKITFTPVERDARPSR